MRDALDNVLAALQAGRRSALSGRTRTQNFAKFGILLSYIIKSIIFIQFVANISSGVSGEEVLQSLMEKTFESHQNAKSGWYSWIDHVPS